MVPKSQNLSMPSDNEMCAMCEASTGVVITSIWNLPACDDVVAVVIPLYLASPLGRITAFWSMLLVPCIDIDSLLLNLNFVNLNLSL